jgi:prevent-host-death family protein
MRQQKWQLQEAKADLSALIRAAEEEGPQTITRNGKVVAVVVSKSGFERLTRAERARQGSLLDFFAAWPSLEIPARDQTDVGREVNF